MVLRIASDSLPSDFPYKKITPMKVGERENDLNNLILLIKKKKKKKTTNDKTLKNIVNKGFFSSSRSVLSSCKDHNLEYCLYVCFNTYAFVTCPQTIYIC